MLLRPDIFSSIGLQNPMNKITNNSVYLDWRTTYPDHRTSKLFYLSERLLSYQQENPEDFDENDIWDHYFPWEYPSTNTNREKDTPFIEMLRMSYSRPRDIVTILMYLQDKTILGKPDRDFFTQEAFESNEFRNRYSEYVLGGIKDQLSFYYSRDDFELLLHFLSFFKRKSEFDYDFFIQKIQ